MVAFIMGAAATAQNSIESILAEIGKNNKTLQAAEQFYKAQNLEYQTGNNPANPKVEYDYMAGRPASAGNQHDLVVSQEFDFPTAYGKKARLAESKMARSEQELTALRQDILLEAKKHCIALVYYRKIRSLLLARLEGTEKILAGFTTKLDKGDGNILDVNKAKLQLIDIKKQLQQNQSDIAQTTTLLTAMNGGQALLFENDEYPPVNEIPPFESLETEYERLDPLRISLEQEKTVREKELELSKALRLPKMSVGYHYQGILGQTYNGLHTGISIPLWEHKNTIKMNQAKLVAAEFNVDDHRVEHYHHIKALYENYALLKQTLEDYQAILPDLKTDELLTKALDFGEISVIQYFLEINYFSAALQDYLQTEMQYHTAISELYKFKL
jgi:outer membrane protein, heavy metal efflux system